MVDAIVVGAGPNGLVAANVMARHGWSVLVLEAKRRPGGALYSEQLTCPGYLHNVGAAFFPFAYASPALREMALEEVGLHWLHARRESCHPAPDGTSVSIARDLDLSEESFGPVDGPAWRKLALWARNMGDRLPQALLAALPGIPTAWKLGPLNLARFGLAAIRTPAGWSRHVFQTPAARRVIPGLALHADLGPCDWTGAGIGLVLALLAAVHGFPVPRGGARAITSALLERLETLGGRIQLETHVDQIVVRENRAVAIRTNRQDEIHVRRAVLADVGAPALYFRLLDPSHVPRWVAQSMHRFRYGWGTFKMDWALTGPVPWLSAEASESAVVHAGDSVDDLLAFTQQVRLGHLPANPYLVIGQQSLADPSRAPKGATRSGLIHTFLRRWKAAGPSTGIFLAIVWRIESKNSPRVSANCSAAEQFTRRRIWKKWTRTWSGAILAAAALRGIINSSFGRYSPIFAIAHPSVDSTCARRQPIPGRAFTVPAATTPPKPPFATLVSCVHQHFIIREPRITPIARIRNRPGNFSRISAISVIRGFVGLSF